MLIYDKLLEFAESKPHKIALIQDQNKISYQDLFLKSSLVALKLQAKFSAGDRIMIRVKDPIEALIYLYGASAAKLISVLVEAGLSQQEEKNITAKVNPKATIDSVPISLTDNLNLKTEINKLKSKNIKAKIFAAKKDDIFLGALSSGSTGEIKVIWRDHQSWTSAFEFQEKIFSLTKTSKLLITGSIVYTGNLNNILQLLAAGGQVVFANSIFPKKWLKLIKAKKINALFMVPTHYRILLKYISDTYYQVENIITAGSKIDFKTLEQLKKYFPKAQICEFYGASELGHISYAYYNQLIEHPGTVGQAFPKVEIEIVNNEIWVQSPYLAVEYGPQASAKDLGYLKDKYLYLSGRKDNIINRGGTKVNPFKIENKLIEYKGIRDVVLIAVDDFLKDKLLVAVVVKSNPDLKLKDLYNYCKENLKSDYQPDKIFFINELPKTKSGKIDNKIIFEILNEKFNYDI